MTRPNNKPEVNSDLKVFLKGESPWARVLSHTKDGLMAKIQNKLFNEYSEFEQAKWLNDLSGAVGKLAQYHNYKKGDEVEFIKHPQYSWIPKEKEDGNK